MLALAGMLTFPLLIVLALAVVFAGVSDLPQVQGALRGMGAVAAGMIAATGLKLLSALNQNVLGMQACWALAATTFVAIALFRVPLIWVLVVIGGGAGWWAYRRLGSLQQPGAAP
jgi:chromate transporter